MKRIKPNSYAHNALMNIRKLCEHCSTREEAIALLKANAPSKYETRTYQQAWYLARSVYLAKFGKPTNAPTKDGELF